MLIWINKVLFELVPGHARARSVGVAIYALVEQKCSCLAILGLEYF